ncbi:MAG TPA: UDP-N-acetylmuramate dehydrogenase [Anaerolineaceae bacterium]|nr:UDP-N-acetylmuramate dehydrogenase [Anaerolineaceae bacterium]
MSIPIRKLQALFGARLQENVRMANYTTSRVGGPALGLIALNTLDEMRETTAALWSLDIPFKLIGSGSNILVSDKGYPGIILLNHCHNIRINTHQDPPGVYAESGANLSNLARQSALRGLSGLEWAGSVPGSVGGAVYGNAGAFGSDISKSLVSIQALLRGEGEKTLSAEDLQFSYRSSILKRERKEVLILSATMKAAQSTREAAWKTLMEISDKRQATQPTGASTGSTFKNPPGDHAGRLIEAAGLKGLQVGHAQFSTLHANFIVNDGNSSAQEYLTLIRAAQKTVKEKFGVQLQLEIELIGEFDDDDA